MDVFDRSIINILIIEDSELSLRLIKGALPNNKYKIQVITSGLEAFNYLLNPKIIPDVILIDNQLPGMDGLEILTKLKNKKDDYSFIFLTVDNSFDTVVKAMKLGALDFIVKSENLKKELPKKIKKVYQIHQNRFKKIESENKFRELYEKSGDAILIIENSIFTDCNKATVKMLNYSTKAEFLNTHPSKLSPKFQPDGKKSVEKADEMMRIALKKGTHRFEWLHTKSNGEIFPVEVLLTAISNEPNNKVIHCVWRDITERKKAEQALKNKEFLLLKSQEVANLGSYRLDFSTGLWESSAMLNTIFGINKKTAKEVKDWLQLIHPEDKEMMQDYFNVNILKHNERFDKEYRIIRKNDQQERWVHGIGELQFSSNGELLNMIGTIQDITERKRQELTKEVILNINKKSGEAIDLNTLLAYIQTELGRLINTDNFYVAFGNANSKMLSLAYMVDEFDIKEDFPKKDSLTGVVIDTKKSMCLSRTKRKEMRLMEQGPQSKCWLGVPLLIENIAIGALVVQSYTDENAYSKDDLTMLEFVASNISQAIKKNRSLEKINLLNQVLIQSYEAVIVTDKEGVIQYVNPAFTRLSGYSEKDALGQNPRLLKSREQPIEYYTKLWNTILGGNNWKGEFVNKRKDGSKYLVKTNISPIKNKKEVITHFVGIQEDITEKRKLERDFIHAFVNAQELEKQTFGQELHDGISQILNAESIYIDLLLNLNKDSTNRNLIELLNKIKELNLSAIHDTRAIAHGLMSKHLKEKGLLKAVAQICEDYNNSRNIVFVFEKANIIEGEIPKETKIQIYRIVQEVSTNIIRHSEATKAMINIKKNEFNQLEIIIKDNGVGFDIHMIKKEKKGAGLKNIERRVKLLNGNLKLKTVPNKGVKYSIKIPLKSV